MTPARRRRAARAMFGVLAAIAILVLGVAVGAVWTERRPVARSADPAAASASPRRAPATSAGPETPEEPIEIVLTPEALRRAEIKTAVVRSDVATTTVSVPGTVASNAYRDTKVNSLVGGVVRQVRPELGATVRRGEPLAVVFSHDLAEAQMRYLSMRAMLEADHAKLERTQSLFGMGVVSRQDLEGATATHDVHATEVAAYRQRLLLYGLTEEQVVELRNASLVVSEVTVHAPLDGVVVSRSINPGQVVTAGQELFVVTDLGTVWVIGDLYEKDFAAVHPGAPAVVVVPATGRSLRGRVAYIDPRVDPATRTAKVRVEVPNQGDMLRLGMFVNVGFEATATERRVLAPREAVQSLGARDVVYVAAGEGRFIERRVRLGRAVGGEVEIIDGLRAGERLVTQGSFFLRAEAARLRAAG